MKQVIVLGGGMVGGVMAKEFAKEPDISVTVANRNAQALSAFKKSSTVDVMLSDL